MNRCYICRSPDVHRHQVVAGFPIHRCRRCGLLWVDPPVSSAVAKSFYDESYYRSTSQQRGYGDYLKEQPIHRANARNIIRLTQRFKPLRGLQVLDVGCAHGFLLDEIRNTTDCKVQGVEISEYSWRYAHDQLGLPVHNCELDEALFPPEHFDVAYLLGTIEHLTDPRKTLELIHHLLTQGGLLVLTTINTSGMIPLFNLKPPEHLYYFNEANLCNLLRQVGFRRRFVNTNFSYYLLYDLFGRLMELTHLRPFGLVSQYVRRWWPTLALRTPTNEMVLIASK